MARRLSKRSVYFTNPVFGCDKFGNYQARQLDSARGQPFMTIPRKGRRSITVDSVMYHYLVAFGRSERVVIQNANGLGPFLFVFPFTIMKPSHIAAAIRFSLSRGWTVAETGHDCWLVFDVDADDQSHFEHLSNDDFRVMTYLSHGKPPPSVDVAQFSDTRPWYNRPSPATGAQQFEPELPITVSHMAR